jgi:uncharacterized protein (TIGR00369 family)
MTAYQASNPAFVEEIRQSFAKQTIMELIGASLTRVEPGVVEITLPYRADLTQQHGYVHAGIVTTIADSDVLAVEFKVNLLRPAKGELFVARAEVIKPGKTLTVVRADVVTTSGAEDRSLVATMQGTMMRLPKRGVTPA